jgi:hypothetical protein
MERKLLAFISQHGVLSLMHVMSPYVHCPFVVWSFCRGSVVIQSFGLGVGVADLTKYFDLFLFRKGGVSYREKLKMMLSLRMTCPTSLLVLQFTTWQQRLIIVSQGVKRPRFFNSTA